MNFRRLQDTDIAGKRVFIRADLNVPLAGGRVGDATRIERLLPTLNALSSRGAKVIVMSHLGRPDGQRDPQYTLRPVAETLGAMMGGKTVRFVEDSTGRAAHSAVSALGAGEILVLENFRCSIRARKPTMRG